MQPPVRWQPCCVPRDGCAGEVAGARGPARGGVPGVAWGCDGVP